VLAEVIAEGMMPKSDGQGEEALGEFFFNWREVALASWKQLAGVGANQALLDWRGAALAFWPPSVKGIGARRPWYSGRHLAELALWNNLAMSDFSRAGVEAARQGAAFVWELGYPRMSIPAKYRHIFPHAFTRIFV
jgi:hypothetical protein